MNLNIISKIAQLFKIIKFNNGAYIYVEPEYSQKAKERIETFGQKPLISIVIEIHNTQKQWLENTIISVERQWYANWEIILVFDVCDNSEIVSYLKGIDNPKIFTINQSTEKTLNIAVANGDYILFMDHHDELTIDALYEVVKAINDTGAEFIYSDEDKLERGHSYSAPHFKPDFSPDMLLSYNYIGHLGVIKKSILNHIEGSSLDIKGEQTYDLYLKVVEQSNKIYHIAKVLYHHRLSVSKETNRSKTVQKIGRDALNSALQRRGIAAQVQDGLVSNTYRVKYEIQKEPLVSIIIPFKDKPELLQTCIESILSKSTYLNFEIIGIDNNSEEPQTFSLLESMMARDKRIQFYKYQKEFNYSAINNFAVKNYAKGEHILLLNNDIEIITPEWIEELLMFSQRNDVGAVGAKLYFSNDTIQHAGVIIGIGGFAGHSHKRLPRTSNGYFNRLVIPQNISAVTGACLMVKKKLYEEISGLDEQNLKIAFNDVDFCLRLQERGYMNIFTPYCEAYHYESLSRGAEDTPEKKARMRLEGSYLKKRHDNFFRKGDGFYNINLSLNEENFSLVTSH